MTKSCKCSQCVRCCERNPGWMSPEDAERAMDAGMAPRLMLDWLDPCSAVGNNRRISVLAPASVGCEGSKAPEMHEMLGDTSIFAMLGGGQAYKGRCTFLEKGLCTIHRSGFKPLQCRSVHACKGTGIDNYDIARLWQTKEGSAAVRRWRELVRRAA